MSSATPEEIIARAIDGRMDHQLRVVGAGVFDILAAKAAIAALTATGYSIVPTEPTEERLDAVREALKEELGGVHDSAFWSDGFEAGIYRAMIAASRE